MSIVLQEQFMFLPKSVSFFTLTDIACSPNFSPSLYFCAKSEVNNTFFFILHFVVFVYRSDLCCKAGVELELMFRENNEAFK